MQTDTPTNTALSMQRLEKAASDAVEDLDTGKSNRFKVASVTGGATYSAQPWDFVVASQSSYVNLPSPNPQLAGAQIALVSSDGSTIRVIALSGKVRASSSINYALQEQTTFICDGVNWW